MNAERTTYFLMANLGSEMIRFFNLQKSKDMKNAQASADRAFHIMDQLIDRKDIGNGKQEVAMLKKLTKDALSTPSKSFITENELNSYFMPFATRTLSAL